MKKKSQQGFTFIEMLVVLTIIVVLSVMGMVNFRVANRKARDGRRQGDLQEIRAALELYRTDTRLYPLALATLVPTYMGELPVDPLADYAYYYSSAAGLTYSLCASLELETGTGCGSVACGTGGTCNYEITNPL